MKTLSYLITKRNWDKVYHRLQSAPEDSSIPIPIDSEGTVYPLHQAICCKFNHVPQKVLIIMINQFPNALDLNAFIGACENPQFSRDSMELILNRLSIKIYRIIQQNIQRYASVAVKKHNTCIVQLFIERFPCVLNSNILAEACMHGTAEMVERILAAGFNRNTGKAGGLLLKTNKGENALDTAIRLYDSTDTERRHILIACLRYANAAKMDRRTPDHDYPIILAAIGLVPHRILESLLKEYAHELRNIRRSGRHAIVKAINMSIRRNECGDHDELPPIFKSTFLINAIKNGRLELIQQLFEKNSQHSCDEVSMGESRTVSLREDSRKNGRYRALDLPDENDNDIIEGLNIYIESCDDISILPCDELSREASEKKNALDVAVDLFDENDNVRCEILRICIQYANMAKLGTSIPPTNYPILLAAVGLVPPQYFLRIGKMYHHEIKKMDRIGKLALKKVVRMEQEDYRIRYEY